MSCFFKNLEEGQSPKKKKIALVWPHTAWFKVIWFGAYVQI